MAVPTLPLKPGQAELVNEMLDHLRSGGVGQFVKPWQTAGYGTTPRNALSGRPYGGYNRFATTMMGAIRGFESPLWLTERQVIERGGTINEEEKKRSTAIIFTGRCRKKAGYALIPEAGQKEMQFSSAAAVPPTVEVVTPEQAAQLNRPPDGMMLAPIYSTGFFVREYRVWNLSQTRDVSLPKKMQAWVGERDLLSQSWTKEDGLAKLRESLEQANVAPIAFDRVNDCFYSPGRHEIHAPREGLFRSELDKWEAIAHETIHATGAKHLLNRPTLVNLCSRGSKDYALEEITAVMGSLFICQDCNVPVSEERAHNWGAYLESFDTLEILEKDPSLFVRALIHADFAAQFTLHPENRPQFIQDRAAPDQIEFSFQEFTPAPSQAEHVPEVEPPLQEATLADAHRAAAALTAACLEVPEVHH